MSPVSTRSWNVSKSNPPLAEQKRIVARVDELMKRCDELEARQKARNERRTALTASCLRALASDTERRTLNTRKRAIERVCTHFPILIDTPESVAELRKTILQLAVQGHLVPQDPRDEPAQLLIAKIEAERVRLHKAPSTQEQGDKYLPSPDETPCELPGSWRWVRLPAVFCSISAASAPGKSKSQVR